MAHMPTSISPVEVPVVGPTGATGPPGTGQGTYIDVTDDAFGAVGDGVTDNREAFAAAAAAAFDDGKSVYVPAGTWMVSDSPVAGTTAFGTNCAVDLREYSDMAWVGEGPSTIIKLDAPGPPRVGDFYMFRVRYTSNIWFRDLTLDGNFAFGTDTTGWEEQIHGLNIGQSSSAGTTGASGIYVHGVRFQNFRGDGIRMLGEGAYGTGDDVNFVSVRGCRFDNCHRSGIVIQRACYHVVIDQNFFTRTNDADIDFEPTGGDQVLYFSITNNHMRRTGDGEGRISIALSGDGESTRHERSVVANNHIHNGMINGINVRAVDILNNRIYCPDAGSSDPNIYLARGVDDVRIEGNFMYRDGTAGQCVTITQNGGFQPQNVVFQNNTAHQYTDEAIFNFDTCSDITVGGNRGYFYNTSTTKNGLVAQANVAAGMSGIKIHGNIIRGDLGGGSLENAIVVAAASSGQTSGVDVSHNTTSGSDYGVYFNGVTARWTGYPICALNDFSAGTQPIRLPAGALAPTALIIGGNRGGRVDLLVDGVPTMSADDGSTATRIDTAGSFSTQRYVREDGKWIPLTHAPLGDNCEIVASTGAGAAAANGVRYTPLVQGASDSIDFQGIPSFTGAAEVTVFFYMSSSNAGTVNWKLDYIQAAAAADPAAALTTQAAFTTTPGTGTTTKRIGTADSATLRFTTAYGSMFFGRLSRPAGVDTHPGDVRILGIQLRPY